MDRRLLAQPDGPFPTRWRRRASASPGAGTREDRPLTGEPSLIALSRPLCLPSSLTLTPETDLIELRLTAMRSGALAAAPGAGGLPGESSRGIPNTGDVGLATRGPRVAPCGADSCSVLCLSSMARVGGRAQAEAISASSESKRTQQIEVHQRVRFWATVEAGPGGRA